MNCKWVAENWTAHTEGALPAWQDALWRGHVALCPKCPGFLESMGATVETIRTTPPEAAPEALKADLLQRLRDRKPPVP